MRSPSIALSALVLAFLASRASAIEIVELKSGKVLELETARKDGDKVHVKLHVPKGDKVVGFALPVDRIVPEFVYYIWLRQVDPADTEGMREIAAWCREVGLFSLAWRTYEKAAKHDTELRGELDALRKTMYDEESAFLLEEAWRLFKDNEVAAARVRIERILDEFEDGEDVGRAKGLLTILIEREQFLDEEKRQERIARRARKQKRVLDRYIDRVQRADRMALRARYRYVHDAKRRLAYAAYTYRKAALELSELLPAIEVDALRFTVTAWLEELDKRMVRTFLRLGDLRFLTGDREGALDAAHEVLSLSPAHKAASDLRDRVLDVPDLRGGHGHGHGHGGLVFARRLHFRRSHLHGFGVVSRHHRYRSYPRSVIGISIR